MQSYLEKCDEAYARGEPLITDEEYDLIVETLAATSSAVDEARIYEPKIKTSKVVKRSKVMKPLPIFAASLNKAMLEEGESPSLPSRLRSFIKLVKAEELRGSPSGEGSVVTMRKLDGVSCICTGSTFLTQGDRGVEGFDISWMGDHINIPNPEKFQEFQECRLSEKEIMIFRGELIMTKQGFKDNFSADFSNARNLVSGVVNSITIDEKAIETCKSIHFVVFNAYVSSSKSSDSKNRVVRCLGANATREICESVGLEYVGHTLASVDDISDFDTLHSLTTQVLNDEEYECDGLVLVSGKHSNYFPQNPLTSKTLSTAEIEHEISNLLNPKSSVAVKIQSTSGGRIVEVTDVTWQLSAFAKLKPVVHFDEVDIGGTKITKCTGKNAGWVWKNKIAPGAIVRIDRTGGVIPNILDVLQQASSDSLIESFPYPSYSPDSSSQESEVYSTEWQGKESKDKHGVSVGVDLIVPSLRKSTDFEIKRAERFWKKLGADGLKNKTLKKLVYENGLVNSDIIEMCVSILLSHSSPRSSGNDELSPSNFVPTLYPKANRLYEKMGGGKAVYNLLFNAYKSFYKVYSSRDLPLLLAAFPYSPEGLGVRTMRLIDSGVGLWNWIYSSQPNDVKSEEGGSLLGIKGVGEATVKAFEKGVNEWKRWCDEIEGMNELVRLFDGGEGSSTSNKVEESETSNPLTGQVFCFTGFRDKSLEEKIVSLGGQVSKTLTKKVTTLVLKNKTPSVMKSAKVKKAEKYGIVICEKDELS